MKPRSEWLVITPEIARRMLAANQNNRRIEESLVAKYVREMRDGTMFTTHQGIAYYDDGSIADGQHRLLAIVRSEISMLMLVTYDLPMKSRHGIDIGKKRTTQDTFMFDPSTKWIKRPVVSAINLCFNLNGKMRPTQSEIRSFADRHHHLLLSVWSAIDHNSDGRVYASAPIIVACISACHSGVPILQVLRFHHVLAKGHESGTVIGPKEQIVDAMRKMIHRGRSRSGMTPADMCFTIMRAIKSYVDDDGLILLRVRQVRVFSVPE